MKANAMSTESKQGKPGKPSHPLTQMSEKKTRQEQARIQGGEDRKAPPKK